VSAGGPPYFNCTKLDVADTPGLDPVPVDFDLERGLVVKGRLLDKATGKPVRGRVLYLARDDNPNLKDYTDLGKPQAIAVDPGKTAEDGSFSVIGIPGPGLLCASADDTNRYAPARLDGVKAGLSILQSYNAVVRIDPSEKDGKSLVRDITLEPGRALSGSVVGPDGKPLVGAYAAGLTSVLELFRAPAKLDAASFTAHGLDGKRTRTLVFVHPEKKLGKVQKVGADEKGPLTVRLEAAGALAGRVVDANGRPRAGLKVAASYRAQELLTAFTEAKEYTELPWELYFDYPAWSKVINREVTTDKDGKFRVEGLIPGLEYDLAVGDGPVTEISRESLSVTPGKERDLGDLKSKAEK
jgi:hypothetical protein